jgi:hypothetical protein
VCTSKYIAAGFPPHSGRAYSQAMAALAQPDVMESVIRNIVSGIPLPEGVRFERLEFRSNWNGAPAVFVVYLVEDSSKSDEDRAKELSALTTATIRPINRLNTPLAAYPEFIVSSK